tara:strand:+ start:212 stop:349 length:138 start_codon:yes stop_codon:yes gene_type:complete
MIKNMYVKVMLGKLYENGDDPSGRKLLPGKLPKLGEISRRENFPR